MGGGEGGGGEGGGGGGGKMSLAVVRVSSRGGAGISRGEGGSVSGTWRGSVS